MLRFLQLSAFRGIFFADGDLLSFAKIVRISPDGDLLFTALRLHFVSLAKPTFKIEGFCLCLCKVKVGKKKAHPSFTAVLRLIVIFLTEIFELAASGSNRRKFPKNDKSLRRFRWDPQFVRVLLTLKYG